MTEAFVVAAIVLVGASGVPGLLCDRRSPVGERIATAMMLLGATLGLAGAVRAVVAPGAGWRAPWPVPGGAIVIAIDGLSALFLFPILLLPALGSIYGLAYWRQAEHPDSGRKLRLFYGLLAAGLALLLVARSGVLFLVGWETMALAAFFLVGTEDHEPAVREASYVYLLATRFGTLALFALFAVLHAATGSLDFAPSERGLGGGAATAVFVLALVGFGLKAGAMPLHIWLPGAHANAPSHVSAVMSGALIKVGIYGLLRATTLVAQPPAWWGFVVLAIGATSAVLGVAFALGQHDLKRLLAYHSIENIGIILIGVGIALLGRAYLLPDLVLLGLCGALLHVWNHGLFKALLFFSAGAVVHATGTREIDRLGGLLKRMPVTGLLFLVGAVAICGLPPLNGLVSELLVYLGLLRAATSQPGALWLVGAFAAPALALVGALALACFTKAFGAVFLGSARTAEAEHAHEAPSAMTGPIVVLAACCLFIGVASPLVAPVLDTAARAWSPESFVLPALTATAPLAWVSVGAGALIATLAALSAFLVARTRLAPADVGSWDCGYASPTARMQYTASSFADSLVGLFRWALRPAEHRPHPAGPFPVQPAHYHSHVPEVVLDRVLVPLFRIAGRVADAARWLQRGNVHLYLLYVLLGLLFLVALAR
jgi:hydrogenase-4 component B